MRKDAVSGYPALFLMILILSGLAAVFQRSPSELSRDKGDTFVEVAGAVARPGVYAFDAPVPLGAAVERAGGVRGSVPAAEQGALFPSGTRIEVLERGVSIGEMSAFYKVTLGIPLSLNQETETGLTALPGVGPGLARAIVRERVRRGGFESLEDVLAVKGLGPGLFHKIAPLLRL